MSNNQCCSFCSKGRINVNKLIAGPNDVFICDECVLLSSEILSKEKKQEFLFNELATLSPKKIKKELDNYVVGQEEAKKTVAVAVNNHYKRLMAGNLESKANVLMIGPTSSGKTLLIKILQKYLSKFDIPVAFADATTLTEAGYVGDDVESILLRLLQESDFSVEKAQKGIVFIDEIDKIASKSAGGSMNRDVSGEGVQQALLGMLQGKVCTISLGGSRKMPGSESVLIDTKDILFICAGAFSGLNDIVKNRVSNSEVGYASALKKDIKKIYSKLEIEDLFAYGMIPEFIGRLPVITVLNELTKEEFIHVLKNTKNSVIEQYQQLFKINGANLIFEDSAIELIAEYAIKKQVTARGLKGIVENLLKDTMFNLEDYVPCNIIIDKQAVLTKSPRIVNFDKNIEKELQAV